MGLAFRTTGLRKHPPLLLLHGFLGDSGDWQALVDQLRDSFYLILVDLPGHGQSQSMNPCEGFSAPFEGITQWVDDILEQLDFQQVSVLGYSLGGRIAMGYALCRSAKVSRLIIESAHPGLTDEHTKQERRQSDKGWAARFASEPVAEVLKDWYQKPVFADLADVARQALITERRSQSGQMLANMLMSFSLADQPDYSQALASLSLPVHFLSGELDSKFAAIGEVLKQAGCINSYHRIVGSGHNIHRVQPEKMAAVIQAFYDINGVNDE